MFLGDSSNLNDSLMVVKKDNYRPTSETLAVLAVTPTAQSSAGTPGEHFLHDSNREHRHVASPAAFPELPHRFPFDPLRGQRAGGDG